MMKKIIAAGHICLDITPVVPEGHRGKRLVEILKPGKLLNVGPADVHTGGSAANTGLALKLLGEDVTLMGKVGDDAFGSIIRELLAKRGVSGLLTDPTEVTSYSVVLALPGVDRIFLHNPGANDSFSNADIPDAALEEAVLFHFGYPPLMKRMYSDGGRELAAIFRRMKESRITTSLDLAAVDPASEAGKADWREILSRVLPYTDFFLPSFEELCFMLDRPKYERLRAEGGEIIERLDLRRDVKPLADAALEMGCRAVLVKCGTSGMYYRTGDRAAMEKLGKRTGLDAGLWSSREGIQTCFAAENVLSATGAGDASIAAFLSAALHGYGPGDCAAFAAAEGACAVTAYDALSGLLPLGELERKIKAGWPTRKEERTETCWST